MSKIVFLYGKEGDPRVAAYAAQREAAGDEVLMVDESEATEMTPDEAADIPKEDIVTPDEVVISAELEDVNERAAFWKAAGITVTTLSKHVEPVPDVEE